MCDSNRIYYKADYFHHKRTCLKFGFAVNEEVTRGVS